MHLGRGYDHAGSRFLDLASDSGIKRDQPNVPACYHARSVSPSLPNSPITSASSPTSAILFAAARHPSRELLVGLRRTNAPRSIVMSAWPSSPTWASSGLGITIP